MLIRTHRPFIVIALTASLACSESDPAASDVDSDGDADVIQTGDGGGLDSGLSTYLPIIQSARAIDDRHVIPRPGDLWMTTWADASRNA